MKEEKDENCENSVLHEIVKKMKYSSQFHARARGVGGVCSWYGRRNTFIIMQCNGDGVLSARAILEFFEILIPLLLLSSTYYDGFVHSKCMKTQ